MDRAPDDLGPRHRRSVDPRPGSQGFVGWGVIWKVCAVLPPLALMSTGVFVRITGDTDSSKPDPSRAAHYPSAVSTAELGPTPTLAAAGLAQKRRIATDPTAGTPSATATPELIAGAVSPSEPASAKPSSGPGPSKTSSPSNPPSSTPPTPDEAREQCMNQGIDPLDTVALTECISDRLNP